MAKKIDKYELIYTKKSCESNSKLFIYNKMLNAKSKANEIYNLIIPLKKNSDFMK